MSTRTIALEVLIELKAGTKLIRPIPFHSTESEMIALLSQSILESGLEVRTDGPIPRITVACGPRPQQGGAK